MQLHRNLVRSPESPRRARFWGRRARRSWAVCIPLALAVALPLRAHAQGKSGVSPSVISLPSGPGAIEGLGASFEPHLNSGTASYQVAVAVPPGVAGHTPGVTLSYDGGGGNGLLGIGWSLDLPTIQRQLDKGLPDYTGADEPAATEDVFLYAGEELVPLSDGTYRCKNEGAFARLRKIASVSGGPVDSWEASLPDGIRLVFGATSNQRVTRPGGDPPGFADTYGWALSSSTDTSGNVINYTFDTFAPESSGVLYPVRIEYARFGDGIHHRIEFLYSGSSSFPENRTDVFSDFRPGFEVRTSRLLREIAVRTDGQLVRRYALGYEPDASLTPPDPSAIPLGFSLLHQVTQFDRSGGNTNYLPPLRFAYSRFGTSSDSGGFGPAFGTVTGGFNFLRFSPSLTEVVDINSDGLPDFISSGEGGWFAYLNRGAGQFSDEVPFTTSAADGTDQANGKRLDEAALTLADLDGDGVTDLFQKAAISERILMHRNLNDFQSPSTLDASEVVRWGPEIEFASEIQTAEFGTMDIADPSIRMLDLDFDKRTDAMRPFAFGDGTGGVEYLFNRPEGWKSELVFTGDPQLPADWSPNAARFDGQNTALRTAGLADLNGDRLEDWYTLAIVGDEVWIDYWPNANGGYWGGRRMTDPITLPGVRADELRLMDVNTDGLTDLVLLEHLRLTYWINLGGDRWSDPIEREDAPPYLQGITVLRTLDVNGNGTTDLFWDNSLIAPGNLPAGMSNYMYFDFVGDLKPNLLTVIDNGIGLRTTIEYKSSAEDYLQALAEGQPWLTKLPFPVTVVSRMISQIGLDLNGDGAPDRYITDYNYRDGYYDSLEKQFRGFAFAEEIERGDDYDPVTGLTGPGTGVVSGPSLVTRQRFLTGAPDEVDNDDYPTGYNGPAATDEGVGTGAPIDPLARDPGGREEQALKGLQAFSETIDPAILSAPAGENAGFHACARAATLALRANPNDPAGFRCAPDKYVYSRSQADWKVRRLYRPVEVVNPPGQFATDHGPAVYSLVPKSVSFSFSPAGETEVIEANGFLREALGGKPVSYPIRSKRMTRTEASYDDYGNEILSADFGIVEAGNDSAFNDERITRTEYALGGLALELWLIHLPARVRVEDEDGVFVSESRHFYDGPELVGLPLGQVGTRGLLKRVESVVTDDPSALPALDAFDEEQGDRPGDPRLPASYAIQTSRRAYDRYGNVIVMMDPLGRASDVLLSPDQATAGPGHHGHFRIVDYDPVRHVYPVAEKAAVGGGAADLSFTAEYDPGFGVITRSTDANGNQTTYAYDSFARLVKVVRPGDALDKPSIHYRYLPGDPQRGLVYRYDDAGNLTGGAPQPASAPVACTVETGLRTDLSTSADYHTFTFTAYASGMGQKLMTVQTDEQAGRWVVQDATRFNLRGAPAGHYQPYYRTDSSFHAAGAGGTRPDGNPVTLTDGDDQKSDALGRAIAFLNPPESDGGLRTRVLIQHLPFETRSFDEEDANPVSPFFETPTVQYSDGLGRLRQVDELTRLEDQGETGATLHTWSTRYEYDLNGQLILIQDSQNNIKWMRHDALGREIFMNDPNRGVVISRYDDASNPVESIDAKSQHRVFTYDGLNRLLTEDYLDEDQSFSFQRHYDPTQPFSPSNRPDVRYLYDAPPGSVEIGNGTMDTAQNTKGYLAAVLDLTGERHVSYTPRGLIEWSVRRITDPVHGKLVSYRTQTRFDAGNRLVEMVYPDNDRISFAYNKRSLLTQIRGGGSVNRNGNPFVIESLKYLPSGQVQNCVLGNGVQTDMSYDPRLRVAALRTRDAGNRSLISYGYQFDGRNNIRRIEDRRLAAEISGGETNRNTQLFGYDDLYRLTGVDYNSALPGAGRSPTNGIRYRYDRVGNLISQTSGMAAQDALGSLTDLGVMTYGGASGATNRLGRTALAAPGPHALTVTVREPQYEYDANGNVTRAEGFRMTWDFKDRLVGLESGSIRAEYVYGYSDQRTVKKVFRREGTNAFPLLPSSTTTYADVNFEVRDSDQPVKYVWNGGTRVAAATGSLDASAPRLQRFRVLPGWNLLSIAVDAPDAAQQLGLGSDPTIQSIHRWLADENRFAALTPSDPLPAGSVLWIYVKQAGTLHVQGDLPATAPEVAETGPRYRPVLGLRSAPIVALVPPEADQVWRFDPGEQHWQTGLAPALGIPGMLPARIGPAEAVFYTSPVSVAPPVPDPATGLQYLHDDHLGSVTARTDAQGQLLQTTAFYPFGQIRHEVDYGDLIAAYKFAQKEVDEESQLQYFEARYLSAHVGRFMSVEPLARGLNSSMLANPQSLNAYAYAFNDPIDHVDPDGKFAFLAGTITGAVKGALQGLETAWDCHARRNDVIKFHESFPREMTATAVAKIVAAEAAFGAFDGFLKGVTADSVAAVAATFGGTIPVTIVTVAVNAAIAAPFSVLKEKVKQHLTERSSEKFNWKTSKKEFMKEFKSNLKGELAGKAAEASAGEGVGGQVVGAAIERSGGWFSKLKQGIQNSKTARAQNKATNVRKASSSRPATKQAWGPKGSK